MPELEVSINASKAVAGAQQFNAAVNTMTTSTVLTNKQMREFRQNVGTVSGLISGSLAPGARNASQLFLGLGTAATQWIPGAQIAMLGFVTAMEVLGPMFGKVNKRAEETQKLTKEIAQNVENINRSAASYKVGVETGDLKDQAAALGSIASQIKELDVLLAGKGQSKLSVIDANAYRDLFEYNEETKKVFEDLFRSVENQGGQIVRVFDEEAFRNSNSFFGVYATKMQQSLRDAREIVSAERKKLEAEIKKRPEDDAEIEAPSTAGFDRMIADLERQAELQRLLGTDLKALAEAREFDNFVARASLEVQKAFPENFKLQSLRMIELIGVYDALNKSRADSAKAIEAEEAARRMAEGSKDLDNRLEELRKQEQLIQQFRGDQEGFSRAMSRNSAEESQRSYAEAVFGIGSDQANKFVEQYLTLYDRLEAAREDAFKKIEVEPPDVKIDEEERIRIRNRESGRQNLSLLIQQMKQEREMLFLTNKEREIQIRLKEADRYMTDGEIEGKDLQLAKMREELEQYQKLRDIEIIADGTGQAFSNMFESIVLGSKSGVDALKDFYQQMQRLVLQQMILGPLAQGISSGLGSWLGTAAVPSAPSPNAAGGVFGPNGYVPFPNMFQFGVGKTGTLGEREEEGVLPLRRGPKGLGVVSYGGEAASSPRSVQVVVNVHTPDADSFRRSKGQVARAIREGL